MMELLKESINQLERDSNHRELATGINKNQQHMREREFPYSIRGNSCRASQARFGSWRGNRQSQHQGRWNNRQVQYSRFHQQGQPNFNKEQEASLSRCILCGKQHDKQSCWKLWLLKRKNLELKFAEINQIQIEVQSI